MSVRALGPVRSPVRSAVREAVREAVRRLAYTPGELFGLNEQGTWYDPSDLTTLFQDSAGTTPVTAHGQPVGLMLDKSGNGHHASQATAASRPLYQSVGGLQYLLFDGIDDWLSVGTNALFNYLHNGTGAFVSYGASHGLVANPNTLMSVVSTFDLGTALVGFSALYDDRASLPRNDSLISLAGRGTGGTYAATTITADNVAPALAPMVVTNSIGSSLVIRANSVIAASAVMASPSMANSQHELRIGRAGTGFHFGGHLYGLIIRGALTDDPTTIKVEQLLATKTGVVL